MRLIGKTILPALLVLLTAGMCLAQGPGNRGAFSAFREKHKYTFQLMQTVNHIGMIDKDAKYSLKPDQAKRVLKVLKPLRKKPKLTQEEAKQALKNLKPIFTVDQLNAMSRIKPRPGGGQRMGGGQMPGGGFRPSGDAQQGQRRPMMKMDPSAMNNFNPFYNNPKSKDEWSTRRSKRWNEFFSGLENKSKPAKQANKATKTVKSAK
ncbi:MAG: hypothetical protein ABFD54_00410 [Armatimonadota bacterium]|nr:hypothetical protein [bacterium]